MKRVANLTFRSSSHLPRPRLNDVKDKNARGRVFAIVGSMQSPGAALLAGTACFRAGAGKVQLATPSTIAKQVGFALPECGLVPLDNGGALRAAIQASDAILIGPGMTDRAAAATLLRKCLSLNKHAPIVLDAIALSLVWDQRRKLKGIAGRLVLTPHHGEMAEMLGVKVEHIAESPLQYARKASEALHAVVVLKGQTTYVTDFQTSWKHAGGCVGLAVSGSGDVLAGIIAGLIATGSDAMTASLRGVAVHAEAGRALSRKVAKIGFLAGELLPLVPSLLHPRENG